MNKFVHVEPLLYLSAAARKEYGYRIIFYNLLIILAFGFDRTSINKIIFSSIVQVVT